MSFLRLAKENTLLKLGKNIITEGLIRQLGYEKGYRDDLWINYGKMKKWKIQ